MEWIDFKERLPEKPNEAHLLELSNGLIIIGFEYFGDWYRDDGTKKPDDVDILKWAKIEAPIEGK